MAKDNKNIDGTDDAHRRHKKSLPESGKGTKPDKENKWLFFIILIRVESMNIIYMSAK